LAVTATLTRGFSEGPPVLFAVVVVAGFISILAVAGLLALVLPVVTLSFGVGLLGRLLH
jgi:threonine/homoserine/homoserine lactone efflux protein